MESSDTFLLVWNWVVSNSQAIIQTVTVIILSWTAIEAFRSRRASDTANSLKLLPLLKIEFQNDWSNSKCYISNIGNGVAYDIKIDEYILLFNDVDSEWKIKFEMKGINLLEPNGKVELDIKTFENGKTAKIEHFFMLKLAPSSTENNEKIQLIVRYRDARGIMNHMIFTAGSKCTSIIVAGKRLHWYKNIYLMLREKMKETYIRMIVKINRIKLSKK